MAPFPAAPFVVLNFVYFGVASVAPLLYPNADYGTISFRTIPLSLLILSLGFLCFDVGVLVSSAFPRKERGQTESFGRISNLGILTLANLVSLWATRTVLATKGFGITHTPTMVSVDRSLSEMSVLAQSLAYIPVSLCLARTCSGTSTGRELRRWKRYFWSVLLTDFLYYTFAGSRQGLLWEALIPVWVCWIRGVPIARRHSASILCVIAVPLLLVIYAQRRALEVARPQIGENHLKLTRDYIPAAERSILAGAFWATFSADLGSDAGRLTAIGPFSGVVEKVVSDQYPLMWGETLADEIPLLVPQALWPTKPVGEKIDLIINRHFDMFSLDELSSSETEVFANFGILGLCLGMLIYGTLTERLCALLKPGSPVSETTLFFVLSLIPFVFHVETDITGILSAIRFLLPVWIVLRLFERRVCIRSCES
jgi:hypothetical protein